MDAISAVWPDQGNFAVATAVINALTFDAVFSLFGNPILIGADTTIADIVQTSIPFITFPYTGSKSLHRDPVLGGYSWYPPLLVLVPGAPPAAPTPVYGWYLTNLAGTVLMGAGNFDTPILISDANDAIPIQLIANYGGGVLSFLAVICS